MNPIVPIAKQLQKIKNEIINLITNFRTLEFTFERILIKIVIPPLNDGHF